MKSHQSLLQEMDTVVTNYLYYLDYLDENNLLFISSKNIEPRDDAFIYVARVYRAFIKLEENDKTILNNEYFKRQKCGWWMSLYEKETYEQLLINAVDHFLRRFNQDES